MRKKLKKRKKIWTIFWVIIGVISLTAIFISSIEISKWIFDNNKTKETIDVINNVASLEVIEDDENTEFVNIIEEKTSDYWYYVSFPLINVDFTELLVKNSDTIAWINVNNTNINYPIVQTTNNDYYLDHSYDKTYNDAGWVFMDYANSSNFSDQNTIIYAHSRLDKTMFGSLSKVFSYDWYTNKDNHIIRISTQTENTSWQIFSVYKIPEETYYITKSFANTEYFQTFINTIINRSIYNFNSGVNINDKILTLSTCYSETERTVVHAKLIKRSLK